MPRVERGREKASYHLTRHHQNHLIRLCDVDVHVYLNHAGFAIDLHAHGLKGVLSQNVGENTYQRQFLTLIPESN
jgi:hypothetical protein